MKKLLLALLLLPNVAAAAPTSFSEYRERLGLGSDLYTSESEEYKRAYEIWSAYRDNYTDWEVEVLPPEEVYPPNVLPIEPYADPTPDWMETTPILKLKPQVNNRPDITPVEPEVVYFPNDEEFGTILISTKNRFLLYTLNKDQAFKYPIGVGRQGFTWSGQEKVSRIEYWPEWIPPKEMLARRPELPERMSGGIKNPLGAVAIYLGSSLYRIHGTNEPKSIGKAESSGCFRMMNEHALHLASIVDIGTTVKVYK